MAQLDFSFDFF